MLGLIPLIVMGGVALKFTDEFVRKPLQDGRGRKVRPFDKEEYRDDRRKVRGLGFGDFSNIGW